MHRQHHGTCQGAGRENEAAWRGCGIARARGHESEQGWRQPMRLGDAAP